MSKDNLMSFLAIDLGASSGRAMLGTIQNEKLELKEIRRFPNPIIEVNDRLYWDLFYLYNEIIGAIKDVKSSGITIESLGIDTWGVDFVCFGNDLEPLRMPYCYRDPRFIGAPERFFSKIPKEEVYKKTGIQIMNFNTLFQLDTMLTENSSIYPAIHKIVFMPDALSYLLTRIMVTEYTIASTSQLLNPFNRQFDWSILGAIQKNDSNIFGPFVFPGFKIGNITPSVQRMTGLQKLSVIAVAGHDTASAVLATPAKDEYFAYLSSGTWSLMGIETKQPVVNDESFALNFTNEGSADGYTRLLKNICGMWLIEQCKKEWENEYPVSYEEIVTAAKQSAPFKCFINPDSPCFAAPTSMIDAIQSYCKDTGQFVPQTMGEIARCIYESLAFRYKQVLADLQRLAKFPINTLHIIGGGAQNKLLNSFTANAIGKPVIAGPSEATAMGNILIQAKAAGIVENKQGIRQIVRNSIKTELFEPEDTPLWNRQYADYLNACK